MDAERAANFGFQGKDIADAVEAAGGGQQTTNQYNVAGRYFYVMVMGRESEIKTISDVGRIVLTSPLDSNIQVPLTSVASVETVFGPLQIDHYNSKRAADIQFTIQGRPLSEVFGDVMSRIKSSVPLPIGYDIVPFGAVNNLQDACAGNRFRLSAGSGGGLPPAGYAVPVIH